MLKQEASHQGAKKVTVGVFLGNYNEYSDLILQGIVDRAHDFQFNTVTFIGQTLSRGSENRFTTNIIYQLAAQDRLDGLIILTAALGSLVSQPEIEAFCRQYETKLPIISIGAEMERIPSLTIDNQPGMTALLSHLIHEHGYRKIAFMQGPPGNADAQARFAVYQETLARENIPFASELVVQGGFVPATAQTAVEELLARGVDFEVLIAANDRTAWATVETLEAHGWKVPWDIAVVGFDDSEGSQYFRPPLTTVAQPRYALGKQAVELLWTGLQGGEQPLYQTFPTVLVPRQSCGCASVLVKNMQANTEFQPDQRESESLPVTPGDLQRVIRQKLLAKLSAMPNVDAVLQDHAVTLLKAFFSNEQEELSPPFLYTFEQILRQTSIHPSDIYQWESVLPIMRETFLETVHEKKQLSQMELRWQQAYILVSNTAQQFLVQKQLQSDFNNRRLFEISQDLINTFSLDDLIHTLPSALQRLNIATCFLCLNAGLTALINPERLPRWSQLAFAYVDGAKVELETDFPCFETMQILPDKFWQHRRNRDLMILPLRFQEFYLGYVIFGTAVQKLIYDALQIQFSSAIRGAYLIRELNQAQAELENRVDERTAALQSEIAERSQAQRSLHESEQRYRALFEQTTDAIFIFALDTTHLVVNQTAADLLGYTVDEVVGMPGSQLVAPDEFDDGVDRLQDAFQGKFIPIYERNLRHKDGHLIPVEINLSLVTDVDGNPLHYQSVVRDISARKQTERLLNAFNQASLAIHQAVTPAGIFAVVGRDLKVVGLRCAIFRTNANLSQLYPRYYNYEVPFLAVISEQLGPESDEFSIAVKDVALFQKTVWDRETIFNEMVSALEEVFPDQEVPLIHQLFAAQYAINAPLIVEDQIIGMLSVQAEDLTPNEIPAVTAFALQIAAAWQQARLMQNLELSLNARLQIEDSLRESEEKYRTLFELSPEAIVLTDLTGMILDANRAASHIGGPTKQEAIGRSFWELGLLAEDQRQDQLEFFEQVIRGEFVDPYELQITVDAPQRRWVRIYPALLKRNDEVWALQFIIHDITQNKLAEQAIQRRVAELEAIHQTSVKLAQASLQVDEIARIAVRQLSRVFDVDQSAFLLWDAPQRALKRIVEMRSENGTLVCLAADEMLDLCAAPVIEPTLESAAPCVIQIHHATPETAEWACICQDHTATLLLLPLTVKDRVLGLLALETCQVRNYSNSELDLGMTLANQIALTLENARLFESATQELHERTRTERALQESEKQFRSIFENAVMGLYRSTPDGRVIMANPALIRMLGYTSFDEISQLNLQTTGFSAATPRTEFEKIIADQGQVIGLESTWAAKDGSALHVQENAKAIYDDAGKLLYYEGTVEDITHRKRVEVAQQISDERFNRAFNISPLAMAIQQISTDYTGFWLLINDAFTQITGYTRAEVIGRSPQELGFFVHPDQQEKFSRLFAEQGYIREFEFEFHKKSGEIQQGMLWSETIQLGDEQNSLILIQNITGRKKIEQERQALIKFQQIVAGFSTRFINLETYEIELEIEKALKIVTEYAGADAASVWLFDAAKTAASKAYGWPTNRKIETNQAVPITKYPWIFNNLLDNEIIRITGQGHIPGPAQDLRDLIAGDVLSAILAIPLVSEGSVIGTLGIFMQEGEKNWSADLESLLKMIGDIIVNALERKRAEESIRQLAEGLEQRVIQRTQQLEAANKELEAFAYSVSHDLRAPLRAIDGFSLALIEDYGDQLDRDAANYLNRVRAASQRMGQLIDDLLKLSRVTRSEMDHYAVDLSALAADVFSEQQEIEPDRPVEIEIQPGLKALGDPHLLRIVLVNLCSNAWKFARKKEAAHIQFGCSTEGDTPVFYLRDNGAGFDMAYADKLFGTFQRLHSARDFEGTGIGLATVKRIIQRHGGRVWAEGEVDRGATFYFTLGEIL